MSPLLKLCIMRVIQKKGLQAVQIVPLIRDAEKYLQTMGLTPATIKSIVSTWKAVIPFMESHGILLYSAKVESDYLKHYFERTGIDFSLEWAQTVKSRMMRLTEFLLTGEISKRTKLSPSFDSEIGQTIETFLEQRSRNNRLSAYTIGHDRYYLSVFLEQMNSRRILHVDELDAELINGFLSSLDVNKVSLRHHVIRELRLYLKYLFEEELLKTNLSRMLPSDAYRKIERLPSVYSKEEINAVCNSIERNSPIGKRNYAVMMLLSRYGLRSSDICGLQFDNILWDKCVIRVLQYKTKEIVELPLTGEVGEALIDYLRHGRPQCDEKHVFIQGISPFRQLTPAGVYTIVKKTIRESGIDIGDRRRGPHALRHSLASLLLKEKVVLPVITSILGHKDSDSTRTYLRIDTEELRKCALDVPPVSDDFYMQEGGLFYE